MSNSYGFSDAMGNGTHHNNAPPTGVSTVMHLTLLLAGMSWDNPMKNTKDAWDFGTNSQAPALNYADYDGDGNKYYCVGSTRPTTGTPIPIPKCGTLIPGQRK